MSKTPAQQAKEFAIDNGFVIEPIRVDGHTKYRVHHNKAPTFERSGYPAIIREMQLIVNTFKNPVIQTPEETLESQLQQWREVTCEHDFVREDNICVECGTVVRSAPGQPYGVFEPIQQKSKADIIEDIRTAISTFQPVPQQNYNPFSFEMQNAMRNMSPADLLQGIKVATGETLDALAQAKGFLPRDIGQSDYSYRNVLIYGTDTVPKPARDFPIISDIYSRYTHVLRCRFNKDDHVYNTAFVSRREALTFLRRYMSNRTTRPTWCVIEPIGVQA